MKTKRFTVYDKGYGDVTIRDGKATDAGFGDVVAVFPIMGGQRAAHQNHVEALRLAKKLAKFMNGKA